MQSHLLGRRLVGLSVNANEPVPLRRRFCSIPRSVDTADEQDIQAFLGYGDFKTWQEVDEGYRSVVLAEAGAGKTHELLARAKQVEQQSRPAFYIRIEDIDEAFEQSFEVGSAESFEQWRASQTEAWFYLDSVDEARLSHPRAFQRAIRRFAAKIRDAQLRAHVCISSRPYAWRPKADAELMRQHLPFAKPMGEHVGEHSQPMELVDRHENALEIYVLQPLDEDDVRLFATHRSAPEISDLMRELERSNLMALAGRPFDLDEILDKWRADLTLGSRSELLRHSVARRLRETDPDRIPGQPLNSDKARSGARAVAAAVVLTGESGILVPDSDHERAGIDAEAVLPGWSPAEVQALLERAVFDDVIYGAVRFRHRDVRELLAAEWFAELLNRGHSRHEVEALFFREQYGQTVISLRLRVVLPWLILEDARIRERALAIHPEIAVEGGDPARLPLPTREQILEDILGRIEHGVDSGSARDNSAIARIAQSDLTRRTLALIERHAANDDAVFFLGRLVWQGDMSDCTSPLLAIAADSARGVYCRVAASRAVMVCGSDEQRSELWSRVLMAEAIPRRLLAELVTNASADGPTVPLLLDALDRLPPHDRFKATGLTRALHGFIERLPVPEECGGDGPLARLVTGLHAILRRPPFIERRECRLSEESAWLLGPAIHAVERLVSVRAAAALRDPALAIMFNAPAAHHWHDRGIDDHKDELGDLVPAWPALNDVLFWRTVATVRTRFAGEERRLDDDLPVRLRERYWSFNPNSFLRVLGWVQSRELEDDRLVALSLAFTVYTQADRPTEWLAQLRANVAGEVVLKARLDMLLNPPVSDDARTWREKEAERKRDLERQRHVDERARSDWIARLKANPGLVRNPPELNAGEISRDQYWLLRQVEGDDMQRDRCHGAAWPSLIDEFGRDVAVAYRDAAMAHWRRHTPGLRSEGAEPSSIPYSLVFGMAGLQIEADEVDGFPAHLSDSEVRLALKYFIYELNGFPVWLEAVHRAHPRPVMEAVQTELFWELSNTRPDQPMHYVLHDLAIYAPWLHRALVEPLLQWIRTNKLPSDDALRHSLRILSGGGIEPEGMAMLAKNKVANEPSGEHRPYWHAMWVDADADTGVGAVIDWLDTLGREAGSHAAQLFITALMGSRYHEGVGPSMWTFRTAKHLKTLYALMHKHIRADEDIERAGGGVYTPGLRDDAQGAREALLARLAEIPGKATYVALTDLIEDHPDPRRRPWMAKHAYKRAEEDGDLEPWGAGQVSEFGAGLTRTPTTQRQLFDLTVGRVSDLRDWLERGNNSPSGTWQRADGETEMRNLVSGWLNQNWPNPYTMAQEPELANSQRVDIWLQSASVASPVPVELKLLNKGWTGPKLCERLRNQLVGDYLRESGEGYGLMLLVWQGPSKAARRWLINGRRVGISNLRCALKQYWASISNSFPNTAAVEVVVIDLTRRAERANRP